MRRRRFVMEAPRDGARGLLQAGTRLAHLRRVPCTLYRISRTPSPRVLHSLSAFCTPSPLSLSALSPLPLRAFCSLFCSLSLDAPARRRESRRRAGGPAGRRCGRSSAGAALAGGAMAATYACVCLCAPGVGRWGAGRESSTTRWSRGQLQQQVQTQSRPAGGAGCWHV